MTEEKKKRRRRLLMICWRKIECDQAQISTGVCVFSLGKDMQPRHLLSVEVIYLVVTLGSCCWDKELPS